MGSSHHYSFPFYHSHLYAGSRPIVFGSAGFIAKILLFYFFPHWPYTFALPMVMFPSNPLVFLFCAYSFPRHRLLVILEHSKKYFFPPNFRPFISSVAYKPYYLDTRGYLFIIDCRLFFILFSFHQNS